MMDEATALYYDIDQDAEQEYARKAIANALQLGFTPAEAYDLYGHNLPDPRPTDSGLPDDLKPPDPPKG